LQKSIRLGFELTTQVLINARTPVIKQQPGIPNHRFVRTFDPHCNRSKWKY